ncbi:hypothetical protein OROMI_013599 [Orobanche minor]
MASSQTTSFTEKKKESIIDGCLFIQSVVMDRIQTENDDVDATEHVVSRIKQTGMFNLGRQLSDLYDEWLVEEFYREASVCFHSVKKGGDVAEISATIRGVEIGINCHLLKDVFSLPSSGLNMEELESFGSEDLMSAFWCAFIGDSSGTKVHPSCHKKRFILPFVYLHDFCCRFVENRTDAFDTCTNLSFRMMLAIMVGEPVNWCQNYSEKAPGRISKPMFQKKSFELLLNNPLSCLYVPMSTNAKKIGPGKFIGGCKPTTFNRDIIPADRPFIFVLPQSVNPRDVTEKKSKAVSSKKRKHNVSDKKSPRAVPEKNKLKKSHKPKPRELPAAPVEAQSLEIADVAASLAQPTTQNLRGTTPTEEIVAAIYGDPEPMAAMTDDQLFAKVEGTGESTAFIESVVTSPVRVYTPEPIFGIAEDAVDALYRVGKALDWMNVSATEEIRSVKSDLSNVADALRVLPQLLKVALANIQQQKKQILEKEQVKYNAFEARTAVALKESGSKLTGHDKNLDNLSVSLQSLLA